MGRKLSEAELELKHLCEIEHLLDPEAFDKRKAEVMAKIQKSRRGRSSKAKGATYERTIKKILKEKLGIDLERTPQSGGFAKNKSLASVRGDLNTMDDTIKFKLHIECKNHKTWSLKEWWRQASSDCPEEKFPVVVMHQGQENKDGKRVQESEDFVFMRLNDFLAVVDKDKIIS